MGSWRAIVPPRTGWLRLLSSPTSYLLSLGFLATVVAKASVLRELESVSVWPLWLPALVACDGLVFLGLAALFAAGENARRWLLAITVPVSALVGGFALSNAIYLGITGEQLTWDAVSLGWSRLDDVGTIVAEQRDNLGIGRALILLVVAAMLPLLSRTRRFNDLALRASVTPPLQRAQCAAAIAAVAGLIALAYPVPSSLSVAQLRANAAVRAYIDWATDVEEHRDADDIEWFEHYAPVQIVASEDVERLGRSRRPHVLLVVLESVRYDHTSLAGEAARANTPNLLALARAGLQAPTTRAVVPHTTKSLFSMMCGRVPLMQLSMLEVSQDLEIDCLASILARAGYRSGFFQSALGGFEDRPRLVQKLGFEHFEAWEDIGGEPLGYLASDDASLSGAVARWLDALAGGAGGAPKEPIFAAVLTSATHHPYRLPKRIGEEGRSPRSDAERYARLVEAADELLGSLMQTLEDREMRDDTIIIVAGDHGEGFGTKGVRQHDNNFYEEGLRVPLVFSGAGVRQGEVEGNASLVDVLPTLLDLLELPLTPAAIDAMPGQSLLQHAPSGPRWFGCWYPGRCYGFVQDSMKVVHIPGSGTAVFDLAADPDEQRALPLESALEPAVLKLFRVVNAHQAPRRAPVLGEVTSYGEWQCDASKSCTHPRSPSGFFEPPM